MWKTTPAAKVLFQLAMASSYNILLINTHPRDLLKSTRDSGKAKNKITITATGRRWGLGNTSTCPNLSICKAKLIESSSQFATRIIVNPHCCCCSLRPKSGLSLSKFVSNSGKFLEPLGIWNPKLKLLHSSGSCISQLKGARLPDPVYLS